MGGEEEEGGNSPQQMITPKFNCIDIKKSGFDWALFCSLWTHHHSGGKDMEIEFNGCLAETLLQNKQKKKKLFKR